MRSLICAILMILCLPLTSTASDIFGLCTTPYWPDAPGHGVCYTESVAKDISDLGAKVMRCELLSKRDGPMDYIGWDEVMKRAKKHGLKVIGVLDYSTLSAPDKATWAKPEYADRFAQRAAEIAKRYKGYVQTWEVWNEPNLGDFRIDPEPYGSLLCKTSLAIKAVDKCAKISTAGFAGAWSGPDDNSAKQFLEKLYESGSVKEFHQKYGKYPFDVVADHPYAWDLAPSKFLETALRDNILGVMERYGDGKKPIIVTEMGWDTDPASSTKMGSNLDENLKNQAKWLTELYDLAKKMKRKDGSPLVSTMCWYNHESPGGMSLLEFGSSKKRPAWNAYQEAAKGK